MYFIAASEHPLWAFELQYSHKRNGKYYFDSTVYYGRRYVADSLEHGAKVVCLDTVANRTIGEYTLDKIVY